MKAYEKTKKIVLLGRAEVGKTSLTTRLVDKNFKESRHSTIGAAYSNLIHDGVTMGIWDTAGQERYNSLVGIYYRGSNVVLMVYDLSKLDSIEKLHFYFQKLLEIETNFYVLFVGTKLDLINIKDADVLKNNVIKRLESEFKNYNLDNPVSYHFVSAKDCNGIEILLDDITKKCKSIINPDIEYNKMKFLEYFNPYSYCNIL